MLNQNLVGTFTHRFSDQFTNIIRGGFTRFQVQETPQDANFNGSQLGLPSGPMSTYLLSGLDPQYAGACCPGNPMPTLTERGVDGTTRCGLRLRTFQSLHRRWTDCFRLLASAHLWARPENVRTVNSNFWTTSSGSKGKHTVRAGVDFRWLRNVFDNGGFSRGMVVSNDIGEFTSDSETCVTCSDRRIYQAVFQLRNQAAQPV